MVNLVNMRLVLFVICYHSCSIIIQELAGKFKFREKRFSERPSYYKSFNTKKARGYLNETNTTNNLLLDYTITFDNYPYASRDFAIMESMFK